MRDRRRDIKQMSMGFGAVETGAGITQIGQWRGVGGIPFRKAFSEHEAPEVVGAGRDKGAKTKSDPPVPCIAGACAHDADAP